MAVVHLKNTTYDFKSIYSSLFFQIAAFVYFMVRESLFLEFLKKF